MNSTTSRPKKSPSSNARRKPERPVTALCQRRPRRPRTAEANERATYRREFRAWRKSLPTQLERDTLLWPEVIAETVVREAERFLNADLPAGFAERLADRAYYLYPRNRHFHKALNRPGNSGRDILYVFMRHWTAGWLRRERHPLRKKLPDSYAMGWPLAA